jgi:endoribonuclease Dicer
MKKKEKALEKFRRNQINILVATNIVEEGVDIPACNMIDRFSKIPNFGSYVQSKGRARSKESIYLVLVDKQDQTEYQQSLYDFMMIEKVGRGCFILIIKL